MSIGENSTQHTEILDPRWNNRDLYWSVRAAKAPGSAFWAPSRLFRISLNTPPHISFDRANNQSITSNNQQIWSNARDWTFAGTASDSDGSVDHVDVLCEGSTCGSRDARRANGTTNWSALWNGLEGRYDIVAYAYDNKGARSPESDRYRIKLGVDLAAPATLLNLNDQNDPARWPEWFNLPVRVGLTATDTGTRDAISAVAEVRYQIDGQGWRASPGSSAVFEVGSDGPHTVQYYAVDRAGNQESMRSVSFKIDRTAPDPPSGLVETHGVISGRWQRAQTLPTFAWTASQDRLSGTSAYQFRLEEQGGANEVIEAEISAQQQLTWTPNKPDGLRTGRYRLRGRTGDNANNWSAWIDLFDFRYDKTAPENPGSVTHTAGISNEIWQHSTSRADFSWPVPHDEGSGVKGYYVVWGANPEATSTTLITQNRFQSPTPLCGAGTTCTGYLRLRSVDNVENEAEHWTTAFVLRYDDAPPTADFNFAEGSSTSQTQITLRMSASDQGSGVKGMRFSHDGKSWTPWEAYAAERPWTVPGISRQSWPVYMQVRDGVDLDSPVISRTIYLDVNSQQPRSSAYRLFVRDMSSGSAAHTSANYQGRSTVGQVVDSARLSSSQYTIVGGYQAASRSLPLIVPDHDHYQLISGIFASGSGHKTPYSSSNTYQLVSTVGEPALASNVTTVQSQQHRHWPGFLAAAFSGPTLPVPDPGPPPPPEPPPACPFPRISINNASLFTNNTNVTLTICAPKVKEMMISNDGGFAGAQWEPYTTTKAWTLTSHGQYVLPRYVYAAFRDLDDKIHSVYFDDIIFDPNPPIGTLIVEDGIPGITSAALSSSMSVLATGSDDTIDLRLHATDDNSGVAEIQISDRADFAGALWQPYSSRKEWRPTGDDGAKTLYTRFRDSSGNISASVNARFLLDTQPPFGGIALDRRVVGPGTITTTVYLGAQDAVSSVTDMRISTAPNFTGAVWRSYKTELVWPLSPGSGNQFTLYVQYRDRAGNLSAVYSDTASIDTAPPVVYADVAPGATLTRTVAVLAYDELAELSTIRLSNDPRLIDGVMTRPYTPAVTWTFDERRVVWVQVMDSVGNWSEPYPVFAGSDLRIASYLPFIKR